MAITEEQVLAAAGRWRLANVDAGGAAALAAYGNLLLRWNARLSLTAIREERDLIERHLMEGAFAAAHHSAPGRALDFGSGTGIPGIPLAILRPDLQVTLAESQRKKAAFLQEAARSLDLRNVTVHAGRAEALAAGSFAVVWMRAVDRSAEMLPLAAERVGPEGCLCVLGTGPVPKLSGFHWESCSLPESKSRVLHIGQRLPRSTWNR